MIGWLSGQLQSKTPAWIVLDVHGVGYELQVPLTTWYSLPNPGDQVMLYVHTQWREEGFTLYGFHQLDQKTLFRQLIRVNGVGPKIALALLSQDLSSVLHSIVNRDMATLTKVPGVGKKTAERLVLELSDKLHTIVTSSSLVQTTTIVPRNPAVQMMEEAIAALEALGYKNQQAKQAVAQISIHDQSELSDIIKQALQGMTI